MSASTAEETAVVTREDLMTQVDDLWESYFGTTEAAKSLFSAAFVGWGTSQNEEFWQKFPGLWAGRVAKRLTKLGEGGGPVDEATQAKLIAKCLRDMTRMLELRTQVEAIDTESELDLLGEHDAALSAELRRRRAEQGQGPAAGTLAEKFAGTSVAAVTKVVEVEPTAAVVFGVTPERAHAISSSAGTLKKVNGIDESLIELVREKATAAMNAVGIEPVGQGTDSGTVSRASAINAALAAVARSSGVEGIVLNEEGELLVELLSTGGDMARMASIDVRLALLADQLSRVAKVGRATHEKVVEVEKQNWVISFIANYLAGERLRIIRPAASPEIEEVESTAPKLLSLRDHFFKQALGERNRQLAITGRPQRRSRDG